MGYPSRERQGAATALEITRCETDADYDEWRRVRIAVIPYERTHSLAEPRRGDKPERLLVLARRDGVVVGHGLAQPSDTAGGGSVIPRVLEEHHRQGVGTALLERLTQDGNAAMRALNTRLGYATTSTGIQPARRLAVD